jgi:hypothetical protein
MGVSIRPTIKKSLLNNFLIIYMNENWTIVGKLWVEIVSWMNSIHGRLNDDS